MTYLARAELDVLRAARAVRHSAAGTQQRSALGWLARMVDRYEGEQPTMLAEGRLEDQRVQRLNAALSQKERELRAALAERDAIRRELEQARQAPREFFVEAPTAKTAVRWRTGDSSDDVARRTALAFKAALPAIALRGNLITTGPALPASSSEQREQAPRVVPAPLPPPPAKTWVPGTPSQERHEPPKVRLPIVLRDERSRRQHRVRPRTVNMRRRAEREGEPDEPRPPRIKRPKTRADCVDGLRPCPFVGCRHHLFLDVTEAGNVKMNFPDMEPDEIPASCSLDVAGAGGAALEVVGAIMNVTRERVRQIEIDALRDLERHRVLRLVADETEEH